MPGIEHRLCGLHGLTWKLITANGK